MKYSLHTINDNLKAREKGYIMPHRPTALDHALTIATQAVAEAWWEAIDATVKRIRQAHPDALSITLCSPDTESNHLMVAYMTTTDDGYAQDMGLFGNIEKDILANPLLSAYWRLQKYGEVESFPIEA